MTEQGEETNKELQAILTNLDRELEVYLAVKSKLDAIQHDTKQNEERELTIRITKLNAKLHYYLGWIIFLATTSTSLVAMGYQVGFIGQQMVAIAVFIVAIMVIVLAWLGYLPKLKSAWAEIMALK
jgi:hypothetical protein